MVAGTGRANGYIGQSQCTAMKVTGWYTMPRIVVKLGPWRIQFVRLVAMLSTVFVTLPPLENYAVSNCAPMVTKRLSVITICMFLVFCWFNQYTPLREAFVDCVNFMYSVGGGGRAARYIGQR